MASKLVLHIGLRKTGSSALQELFHSETALLGKLSINYPDRLTRFPAHQELAWCLMDPVPPYFDVNKTRDEVYDHYCAVIDANLKNGDTTLLSTEDLSLLTFDFSALSYVHERFAQYEPQIVMYARPPLAYHISNYKHALVAGRETRSFADYVFNINSLLYSQPPIIRNIWASVFGKDNVTMLKYEPAKFAEKSIFPSFLEAVFNKSVEDTYQSYKSNTGIPNEAVDYILGLNRSDLPDEKIREVKNKIRALALSSGDDSFLKGQLSETEITILRRVLH